MRTGLPDHGPTKLTLLRHAEAMHTERGREPAAR
jgi:hypothetical protein